MVTGAGGLLGSNLVRELAARGCAVAAVYGRHPIDAPGIPSAACDLADPPSVDRALASFTPPYCIVHCAAATNVDWCEAHPLQAMRLNAEAARKMAVRARSLGAGFVHISTDSVFGGESGGYRETDPVAPVNAYARSKALAEAMVLDAVPEALVLRVNFYGWNHRPQSTLAEWVLARLASGTPVPGFTDVSFSPVLANSLAGWILRLARAECSGIYHLGSSDHCTKFEFARKIAEVFQLEPSLVRESRLAESALQAPRPHHTWLRTGKAAAALGQPMPTIRQGLETFRALRGSPLEALCPS